MLMFNYGILATFIPELVMVIGFLLSIIVPTLSAKETASTVQHQTIYLHTVESLQAGTTYVVSSFDFQQTIEQGKQPYPRINYPIKTPTLVGSDSYLVTSDGLSFVQFSRPPPSFFS